MSVQTELDRIIGLVDDSHEAVKAKGGTTATPYLLANLPDAIESIPEASDPVLQEKTVTPATSAQSVTPDSGYDGLSKVNVNAMPTATQATPSISVSSGGLITASSTQTAGYVASGTKSATKQLTTQAAKTVTPTTSNQTAVASGLYTTGAVTVAGDANLVAGNIKSGVSIFGVAGSYEGSGGGGSGGGEYVSGNVTYYVEDPMYEPGASLYYFDFGGVEESEMQALLFTVNYTRGGDPGQTGFSVFRSRETQMLTPQGHNPSNYLFSGFFYFDYSTTVGGRLTFVGTINTHIGSGENRYVLRSLSYEAILL